MSVRAGFYASRDAEFCVPEITGNSFKYTCLVLNTFVNINLLYVIMQLILLSGDLCCKHVLKVC